MDRRSASYFGIYIFTFILNRPSFEFPVNSPTTLVFQANADTFKDLPNSIYVYKNRTFSWHFCKFLFYTFSFPLELCWSIPFEFRNGFALINASKSCLSRNDLNEIKIPEVHKIMPLRKNLRNIRKNTSNTLGANSFWMSAIIEDGTNLRN